jgi:hypothetical protein
MKAVTVAIIAGIIAVAVAGSLVLATFADPGLWGGTGNVTVRPGWSAGFNGCCFDDGVRNAAVLSPPTIHTGTSVLYLGGSLSIQSWTHFNGTGNDTGTCAPPTGPAGACDAYVGIWTPSAWDAFVAGGPMQPFWCYPGNGSSCVAVNSASFNSSSLTSLEGAPFDIVIWNNMSYGLMGSFTVTLYVSPDYWSS